jgi:hypothetical protein
VWEKKQITEAASAQREEGVVPSHQEWPSRKSGPCGHRAGGAPSRGMWAAEYWHLQASAGLKRRARLVHAAWPDKRGGRTIDKPETRGSRSWCARPGQFKFSPAEFHVCLRGSGISNGRQNHLRAVLVKRSAPYCRCSTRAHCLSISEATMHCVRIPAASASHDGRFPCKRGQLSNIFKYCTRQRTSLWAESSSVARLSKLSCRSVVACTIV